MLVHQRVQMTIFNGHVKLPAGKGNYGEVVETWVKTKEH